MTKFRSGVILNSMHWNYDMTELFNNIVLDKLGKEWPCLLETTKNGVITVHINGYSTQYPLILSRDVTFIKNINKKLKKLGFNEKIALSLNEIDDIVMFSTNKI